MSTFEPNEADRALLKHYLEQARSVAARLPEFEGAQTIRALNELLGLRPSPRAHLRALPTWGRDPEGGSDAA